MSTKTLTKSDLSNLRVAVAERDASVAIVACVEQAILSASPHWQHLLSERAKLAERQAAFDLVMRDLRAAYGLSPGDQVDQVTGEVTPVEPAEEPAQEPAQPPRPPLGVPPWKS